MIKRIIYFGLGFATAIYFMGSSVYRIHQIAYLSSTGYFYGCVENRVSETGPSYGVHVASCGKKATGVYYKILVATIKLDMGRTI
jgi:hypothetical protein